MMDETVRGTAKVCPTWGGLDCCGCGARMVPVPWNQEYGKMRVWCLTTTCPSYGHTWEWEYAPNPLPPIKLTDLGKAKLPGEP
jgi:hypothetical protein